MDATEFCALAPDSIAKLLAGRQKPGRPSTWHGQRNAPRWPFPSTVELWVPDSNGEDRYLLATSVNLSTTGIGLKVDESIPLGTELGLAIHEPEMSFHGKAIVRHCTETGRGYWLTGLQFVFEEHPRG